MATITAQEAAKLVKQEQRERNSKTIEGLPRQLAEMIASNGGKPLYIFNVGHQRWTDRPGGNKYFVIEACEPGQRYSRPTVVPFIPTYHVAVEMNKMEQRLEDCYSVALDIIGKGPFKARDNDLTRFGVFIATGETPTEQELAAANAEYEKSDMEMIQMADQLANEGPNGLKSITGQMRDACVRRSVVRDWAKAQKSGQQCPGCGEMVASGIRKHPLCGWRFDLGCFEGEQHKAPATIVAQAAQQTSQGPQPGRPIRQS